MRVASAAELAALAPKLAPLGLSLEPIPGRAASDTGAHAPEALLREAQALAGLLGRPLGPDIRILNPATTGRHTAWATQNIDSADAEIWVGALEEALRGSGCQVAAVSDCDEPLDTPNDEAGED